MKINKKMKILNSRNTRKYSRKFFKNIFCVWAEAKQKLPDKLVCFWCEQLMEPNPYFNSPLFFMASVCGSIFERPTRGHLYFNKLYKDTVTVELCEKCYYDLDMFNKTGLWFEEINGDV